MTTTPTVLVTGASGFIGSTLVRRLAADGARVFCLARPGGRARPEDLPSCVEWTAAKVHDVEGTRALLGNLKPEIVFNLAAYGVGPKDRDVSAMVSGNIGFLANLIQALTSHPPQRILHVGSCSEYAPAAPGQRLKETDPIDPPSLYGAAKAAASLFGRELCRRFSLPFATLRLFGTFGPREAGYRLIPYLLHRLRSRDRVDLTPGEQLRDLLYIDDVVDALLAAASAPGIKQYQSYNICSGVPLRIRDVAEAVCRHLEQPESLLAFGARPYRPDEPMEIVGDPSRFRNATGWSPRIGLDEGIQRMIEQSSTG